MKSVGPDLYGKMDKLVSYYPGVAGKQWLTYYNNALVFFNVNNMLVILYWYATYYY